MSDAGDRERSRTGRHLSTSSSRNSPAGLLTFCASPLTTSAARNVPGLGHLSRGRRAAPRQLYFLWATPLQRWAGARHLLLQEDHRAVKEFFASADAFRARVWLAVTPLGASGVLLATTHLGERL